MHLRLAATLRRHDTSGKPAIFTPATLVDDSQVSIAYGDQVYEPRNYHETFHGEVTARYALALSLNNATVRVAQEVGFDKVAALAKAAGISSVRATPAIALGAYDATRWKWLEPTPSSAISGTHLSPLMVKSVRDARGRRAGRLSQTTPSQCSIRAWLTS